MKDRTRFPSPYEPGVHKTEWTCTAKLAEWMNKIIEEKKLPLGKAEVETTVERDKKRVDIIIFESSQSSKVLCVIEAKQPYFDVFDENELKEPARKKAVKRKAPYFATCNFQKLLWFNTERANRMEPEEKQIHNKYELSEIYNLDYIEEPRFKNPIVNGLTRFLSELVEVYTGKKPEPLLSVDELLIFYLYGKVNRLARYYKTIISDITHKDTKFRRELQKWFIEQQWQFTWQDSDYEKVARQTAYLLINKILFYQLLKAKRTDLGSLEIPADLVRGGQLQTILQGYFSYVLKNIDYETIYSTDFIDQTAFPDDKEVVYEVKDLVSILNRYDFSKIGYEIIGSIFQRLIPMKERHTLGQYFTSADVVDIILRFCLKHEEDKVLDPSCGAGTFLMRAYQHKKIMNDRLSHIDILGTLWGVDIAKFPAHLATINLAIQDLSVDKNYPNIIQEDFFNLLTSNEGFELPERWRKVRAKTLGLKEREVMYPRYFECVVGNPPYTRQEEISEIADKESYKDKLIENALYDINNKKIADISKRAGIHAYFFVHGLKFLKNGGRFGFIVSNSWLDVDYGRGLQELFLKNYKIIAIIESKVERWFEEADINTCIVILEKCKDKKERDENFVRFVYLFKPLRHFIPPVKERWEEQVKRLDAIDSLIHTILAHKEFYQNEELRIFPKLQKELWDEGFDTEQNKYVGSKWGKYIRAPEIFFKILEKCKDKLVPLKKIADVRFGIKTGANEFFYLTEEEIKRRKIEKEFWMHKDEKGNLVPNYVIEKALESRKPQINSSLLKKRVLFIRKSQKELKSTQISSYIKNGEKKGYNKRPTCLSREPGRQWYDLGENINDTIAFPERVRLRHIVFYNPEKVSLNKNLYGIEPSSRTVAKPLAIILNSTLTSLYLELFARQPGGGGGPLDIDVYVAKDILIPNKTFIEKYSPQLLKASFFEREIESIFRELSASVPEEVSLDKVKPDRRKLDKIVMGEILGLTDEEQLEVYRAVVDLVKSRIDKAKSFGKRKKTKEGIDIEAATKSILERIKNK